MVFRRALIVFICLAMTLIADAQDISNPTTSLPISSITGLGTGVATLLGGASSGTGGPAGTASPTFTGTSSFAVLNATGNITIVKTTPAYVLVGTESSAKTWELVESGGNVVIQDGTDSFNSVFINPGSTGTFTFMGTGGIASLGPLVGTTMVVNGSGSGAITIKPQAAAGTYNLNLPTTAGTSGQVLTSQGGGSTPMTWTSSGTGTVTSVICFGVTITTTGTCTTSGQLPGTATNDNASAGNIGEYISSTVIESGAVPITSNMAADITSISLTAGDWNVWGAIVSDPAASTTQADVEGWISTTSATEPTKPNGGATLQIFPGTGATGNRVSSPVGMTRVSLAGTTTVYLSGESVFGVSTSAMYGFIGARRVR